jgi:hypothetical protein
MNANVMPEKDFYPLTDDLVNSLQEITKPKNKPGRRKTDFAKACGQEVLCRADIEERKPELVEPITPNMQDFIEYEEAKSKKSGFIFWGVALAEIVAIVILSLL